MAKGSYIGVSSVARKVKKMYIGVGGVARKVKKAYIGVNGVARLWWSGGGGIDNYAILTSPTSADNKEYTANNSIADFSEHSNNIWPRDNTPVYFNGRYLVVGWNRNNFITTCGIYYKTSLTGTTYTLAKRTSVSSKNIKLYDLLVRDTYIYALFGSWGSTSPSTVFYARSSDGINWTLPSLADNYQDGAGNKYGKFTLYNNRIYFSGVIQYNGTQGYYVAYVPISSLNASSGSFTPTQIYPSSASSSMCIGQMVVDKKTNIGYFPCPIVSRYDNVSITPQIGVMDMATHSVTVKRVAPASSLYGISIIGYNHTGNCGLAIQDGKLYLEGMGLRLYANLLSSVSENFSWVGTFPTSGSSSYITSFSIFVLGGKIVKIYDDTSSYTDNYKIYYRTGNSLTVSKQFTYSGSTPWMISSPISLTGVEFGDFDKLDY